MKVAENVTGKMLVAQQIKANNDNRNEIKSLSFNIKQVKKHGAKVLALLKVDESELTPVNLKPHFKGKELTDKGTCYWYTLAAIKRYSRSKKSK